MKTAIYVIVSVLLLSVNPGYGAMNSANFSIKSSVISSGGNPMASTSFRSNSTIGQSSITNSVTSTGYELFAGFWYTMITETCIWDLDPDSGDGDVDGFDFYRFVNPPFEAFDIEGFGSEFGSIDCF